MVKSTVWGNAPQPKIKINYGCNIYLHSYLNHAERD